MPNKVAKRYGFFFLFIIELSLAYISRSHWVMLNNFLISFFTHKCHFLSSSARGNWIVKAHLGEMDSKTDLITRYGLNWHRNLLTEEIFFHIHKSLVFFTAYRNTILAEKEQTLSQFTEQTKNKRQMYWPKRHTTNTTNFSIMSKTCKRQTKTTNLYEKIQFLAIA